MKQNQDFLSVFKCFGVFCLMVSGFLIVPGRLLWADTGLSGGNQLAQSDIAEKQVVEINQNLKNVIEENQKLSNKTQELESQVTSLQEKVSSTETQYGQLKNERDSLVTDIKKTRDLNREYSQEIQQLKDSAQNSEVAAVETVPSMSKPPDEVFQLASVTDTDEEVKAREEKTLDLLSKVDAFAEQDERLRMDAAKAHYNMGNIYFQKGEFEIAAREYYQAVTLMPDDPDAHYNLAFVSGEYLNDQRTALKHYQMYLYLSPQAKDAHLVKEKIVKAKLALQAVVDSPLEKKEK